MLETIVGAPATGKTAACIKRLHELTRKEQPVIWIGEPHQRERTIERWLREPGTLLNARYFTFQQLYYRILQNHPFIKPLASPGLTVANVARAIYRVFDRAPTPGEATLYLNGIRELKRSRLTATDLMRFTNEERILHLTRVFEAYDDLTSETWDRDDYRAHALDILKSTTLPLPHIIIDGIMDPDPADLLIVAALANHTNVTLAIEEEPAGLPTTQRRTLTRTNYPTPQAIAFPNAAKEARWVIRSAKRDLSNGIPPHEVGIITTPEHKNAFLALAREAGVPTHDATPATLADTAAARLLFRLLSIVTNPDPIALSAHPDLTELARVIQNLNVRGIDAVNAAAERSGVLGVLDGVRALLMPPDDPVLVPAWADGVLRSLPSFDPSVGAGEGFGLVRAALRQRAVEASTITVGSELIGWWGHLCSLYPDPSERPHGVPVLTMLEATGLQFERAYVTEANAHQHRFGVSEDHFFPEDARGDANVVANAPRKRCNQRSTRVQRHARHRSERTVVTFTTANQEGPTLPNDLLVMNPIAAPVLPAAHEREVAGASGSKFVTRVTPVVNTPARVRARVLETQVTCGFKARFEEFGQAERPAWVTLIGDLTREAHREAHEVANLAAVHPTFAGWLREQAEFIAGFELKHEVPLTPEATPPVVTGLVHGSRLEGDAIRIVWFTNPNVTDDAVILKKFMNSWEKTSIIRALVTEHAFKRVIVMAAPVGSEPRVITTVSDDGHDGTLGIKKIRLKANFQFALKSFSNGNVTPNPGFHCRTCRIADACRAHGG